MNEHLQERSPRDLIALPRRVKTWATSERGALVIVALITLFALGLRLWNLDREPLHVDELVQVAGVQGTLPEVIGRSYDIAMPPADYVVGWLVVQVAPATDFTQRLPAALFGTAAVGLVGLVLARTRHRVAAIFGALFLAISPLLVELSQYARPYALPVFAVVATVAVYQHWHRRSQRTAVLIVFGLVAALALLSRPMMPVIALGTLGIIALARGLSRNSFTDPVALLRSDPPALVVLPTVFLFVWVPSTMFVNSGFLVDCWRCDQWARLAKGVENFGEFGEFALRPTSLLLLLSLSAIVLVFPAVRRALGETWYLWAPLLVTGPVHALVHAMVLPPGTFFAIRYLIFLPVGLAVYLAISLSALATSIKDRHITIRMASVAVLLVFAVPTALSMLSRVRFQSEGLDLADWRSTAEHIEAIETGGDVIVSIDTRPFSEEKKFGFMAHPRYYDGPAAFYAPEQLIANPSLVADAGRYHFVLFVPKMAGDWSLPTDWTVAEFSEMLVLTTPPLESDEERLEAWSSVAGALRSDVAVTTRIAGGALAHHLGAPVAPWLEPAADEASVLGETELADALIAEATAGS